MSLVSLDTLHMPSWDREAGSRSTTLWELCESAEDAFSSSVLAGFLSSVVRSAPIEDTTSFDEAKPEGLSKELLASILEYHPRSLDYSCIFRPSAFHLPFSSNLDPCPTVARGIYHALCSARSSLQNTILYPRCGKKTVGREVAKEFWDRVPPDFTAEIWDDHEETGSVTTQMVQKLMFWKGIDVPGPVEVRTAWKYNDLKPRVYFAQGGDTFPSSRYVQGIFNTLVDHLEPVHRQNRYYPPSGILEQDDLVAIYDYSSFTSSLDEIHGFLGELAIFMDGVTVLLIGDLEGPRPVSLGDLLRQFAQECNEFAEFDIGR